MMSISCATPNVAPRCRAALSVVAEEVPVGSQIVLAGRTEPPVRIARLRGENRLVEVTAAELSMDCEEAGALLDAAEVTLDADDVATLHERAEGWPVGLYLAALYLREGGSVGSAATSFSGDDRLVSDYMESEFLAQVPARERNFLIRSAALERMSAAVCEATLDLPDAATSLADLTRSNMLLVPLDRRGQWYRYHHLFGDMLRAELERREPGAMSTVRRRAAEWCLENDEPEEALEYSMATGDTVTAARLIEQLWPQVFWRGHTNTIERWIDWMDERDAIRAHPMIAVIASLLCSLTERAAEAVRWSELLDRWRAEPGWSGDLVTEGYVATLRVVQPRDGVAQMRADLDEATEKFAAAGMSTQGIVLYHGFVCLLEGEAERAGAYFQDASSAAEQMGSQEVLVQSLYQLSLLAMKRDDWTEAQTLSDALRAAYTRPGPEGGFVWTAQARIAAHHRDFSTARDALAHAQQFRSRLASGHIAVQLRIELARVYLAVADFSGARTLMREASDLLRQTPDLGSLIEEVEELQSVLAKEHGAGTVGPSALSTAELRLLPMLCTHLTVKEIAAELFRSRNTISTQMQSIYRKLDANTRSQAVTRARELHLVE
jgi:LuxR family transcriptional regulator, maltose regulon positive regulatory protein